MIQRKFDFPLLHKHAKTWGTIDAATLRPQVITMDVCKHIVIENDRDLFVDVDHEAKLMVFIWSA
jgi:hypothetical protein